MLTPINDGSLVERADVGSGPIKRRDTTVPGEDRNTPRINGVIYATSADPSPSEFDVNVLLGSTIENKDLSANDPDRFFKIIGGYFMERTGRKGPSATVTTMRVFGVARGEQNGFGITEGGTTIVADHWVLTSENLPENLNNERLHGPAKGWTFIVEEKQNGRGKGKYPPSDEPIDVLVECPSVSNLVVQSESKENGSLVVDFQVIIEGPTPDAFIWDFGDGSPAVTTKTPAITHTYVCTEAEDKTFEVSVSVTGPGECSAVETSSVVVPACPAEPPGPPPEPPRPPSCPEIDSLTMTKLEPQEGQQRVQFRVVTSGPTPTQYIWDFGDASHSVTTSEPFVEHTYDVPFVAAYTLEVRVQVVGPGECNATESDEVTIEPYGGTCGCRPYYCRGGRWWLRYRRWRRLGRMYRWGRCFPYRRMCGCQCQERSNRT